MHPSMTYATWITQLRKQVGDTYRRVHVDWTGDGSTSVFQMPEDTFPVLDDSTTYTVKVAGTTKTENTHYTIDKSAGTLSMISTPTNGQAVAIDAVAVNLLDADWLQITNDVIKSLGDDFFKEFVDDTSLTTTANALTLDLSSAQANCIAIYDLSHRKNTGEDWVPAENYCNWRYSREENKIYFSTREAFTITGELFKIRGLKTYTAGSAVSDTLDVQDRFLTVLEFGCIARYWRWNFKRIVETISKVTTENTRTPLQEMIMIADRFDRLYESEKAKLKPAKPPRMIPVFKEGVGRA